MRKYKENDMRAFDYINLKNEKWDSEIVGLVAAIHEAKGRQELYIKQKQHELFKLIEITKIQSTQSSNAIEGIYTTNTRLKQIIANKVSPKNRDEEEIAGYKDVLNIINESYESINISSNYILQLHKILYSHSGKSIGGKFKSTQNYINASNADGKEYTLFTPLSPFETPPAIDNICDQFNRAIAACNTDPLILIPIFIHDFLCIHPFLDGNGRMSRLLTNLLLYKHGYFVGKYISLEAKIAKNKDLYYDALANAQFGWHDGKDDPIAFIKYLLGVIISSYRDLDDRLDIISDKLPAIEIVRKAIQNKIGKFSKIEISELCPSISMSSLELALKKLVANGELIKQGAGKSTVYIRTK